MSKNSQIYVMAYFEQSACLADSHPARNTTSVQLNSVNLAFLTSLYLGSEEPTDQRTSEVVKLKSNSKDQIHVYYLSS